MSPRPLKPPMSLVEHLVLLERRGMTLDRREAERWLTVVGYYRLSGYWYPYRRLEAHGRSDAFIDGTRFEDVAALYEFDRKLRTLLFDGLERVEVALRSALSRHLATLGAVAYLDSSHFRDGFGHDRWLQTARSRVDRAARHNPAIKHHREVYGGDAPVWVLMDVLDFADISRLYEGLGVQAQWIIAAALGIRIDLDALSSRQSEKARKTHPLVRWFEQLSIVRNACAHHGRVWNRSFTPAATAGLRTVPGLAALPVGQSEQVFGAVAVIGTILRACSPGSTWAQKMARLIREEGLPIPGRRPAELGFPENWELLSLWAPRV